MRRTATRDDLAGTLWSDLAGDRATKNLRTTLGYVHHLLEPQRVAGDAPWFLRLEGHQVRVLDELDVDLWRFTDLLVRADAEERAGHPTASLPLLLEACSLWRGDLAADLDAEFLELDRIHLRSRYVRAACRAAELLVATDRPTEAIEVARLALATDRWSERGYQTLAAAYSAMGDRTAASAVLTQAEQTIGELADHL
jgi:DNA-binding SARP family transcriptional activator